jgi:hypothetical protein
MVSAVKCCLGSVPQLLTTTWSNARTDSEVYWREGAIVASLYLPVWFVNVKIFRNKRTFYLLSAQAFKNYAGYSGA